MDKTWFQKCIKPIFLTKLFPIRNFSQKFQVRKKLIAAPPMAILGSKEFRMQATQKCLKVSKIWWYFVAIFLRVSCKFKPTVPTLHFRFLRPCNDSLEKEVILQLTVVWDWRISTNEQEIQYPFPLHQVKVVMKINPKRHLKA